MKIIYYIRVTLFTLYLICMFLLIDNLFKSNLLSAFYFILNFIYSFLIIISILSKKKCFIESISYNILNIGIYIYTFIIFYMVTISSKLEILNNSTYYRNNFVLLILLLIGLIAYTLYLNKEEK